MTAVGEGTRIGSVWGPLGGDFGIRLASALVLFGIALVVLWQGGWLFAAWIALACAVMAVEWERMTQAPFTWIGAGIAIAGIAAGVALATLALYPYAFGAVGLAALAAFLHAQLTGRHRRWAFALPLYLGIPAITLVWLRAGDPWLTVLWFMFVVWATDSLAMISGRIFKGPLLAPVISPKKTWSGFIGGTIGALIIGTIFYLAVTDRLPGLFVVAAMAAMSILGQAGDVMESAIKRRFNAKDAGGTIPGHGGMLDRMDSLLVATLVFAAIKLAQPAFPFGIV